MTAETIFITGATGFIGAQTADQALKAGYRVRLSVRKQQQVDDLKKLWSQFSQQLEFAIVPDITAPNAFENKLDGVSHVFHLASPIPGPQQGTDMHRDYIDPAVKGTKSILEVAITKPAIKTVIITSSVVSLVPVEFPSEVHVKDNTGEQVLADVDSLPEEVLQDPMRKYHVSKILAHQYTKDFLEQRKPHFKLLTFHPVVVLGHSISQKTAEGVEGMNAVWWASLQMDKPVVPPSWVSVYDVGLAHLKALQSDVPTGTELLLSGETLDWSRVLKFLKEKYPNLPIKLEPPFSTSWDVDTTTADKYLGIQWKSQETIAAEVVDQQLAFRSS